MHRSHPVAGPSHGTSIIHPHSQSNSQARQTPQVRSSNFSRPQPPLDHDSWPPSHDSHSPQEHRHSGPQYAHPSAAHESTQTIVASASPGMLIMNPHHFELLNKVNQLEIELDTLRNAYRMLATSIPQIFAVIPNPYQIHVPPSLSSSTTLPQNLLPPQLPTTKPHGIRFWTRESWTGRATTDGQLTVSPPPLDHNDSDNDPHHSDDDASAHKDGVKKKKRGGGENVLGFLEKLGGVQFTKEEITFVRKTAYEFFQALLDAGEAPTSWSRASAQTVNRFRHHLVEHKYELAFGKDYWKIDVVATEVYAQFVNHRRQEIKDQLTTGKKRKRTDDSKDRAPKKGRQTTKDATDDLPPPLPAAPQSAPQSVEPLDLKGLISFDSPTSPLALYSDSPLTLNTAIHLPTPAPDSSPPVLGGNEQSLEPDVPATPTQAIDKPMVQPAPRRKNPFAQIPKKIVPSNAPLPSAHPAHILGRRPTLFYCC
ncbi:hypothetical protein C8F01DRAFT_1098228 [Mycena amicta]|nr:hypothetical protein C8F01DRAFT_1098228 [Mycena amicta]